MVEKVMCKMKPVSHFQGVLKGGGRTGEPNIGLYTAVSYMFETFQRAAFCDVWKVSKGLERFARQCWLKRVIGIFSPLGWTPENAAEFRILIGFCICNRGLYLLAYKLRDIAIN